MGREGERDKVKEIEREIKTEKGGQVDREREGEREKDK